MARTATMLKGSGMVGGLAGGIPTSEIPKARRAYLEYVENFMGDKHLDFAEFVHQVYKKRKSD